MKNKLFKSLSIMVFALMILLIPCQALAEAPYEGYIWNNSDRDVESINGYMYEESIDGAYLPTGAFNSPEDIFITKNDSIYIVDTGNNRIVHLDENYNVVKTIGDKEGPGVLNGPKGIYVKEDGTIYVADTKNQRIVIFDKNGNFIKEFKTPESPLLGKNFSYSPSKLILDKRDYLFVVSEGNTKGLMQIDPEGEFKGFFGANDVGFSLKRLIVRLIATEDQEAKLESVQPLAFSNIDLDNDGFIYTTTLGTNENQIKRLSPVGVDTLNNEVNKYGDLENYGAYIENSAFIDLSVNDHGLITSINLQTSRIYQYDRLGNLLFIFGGLGDQNGLFTTPSSIDQNSKGEVFVVDKGRNRVDIFRTTPFADLVHEASELYVQGRYEEAKEIWEQVIQLNGNYDIAYHAIGKALHRNEQYKEAMEYFKLANSRSDYSVAFREYRVEFTRNNFAAIFFGIILLFVFFRYGIPLIKKIKTRKKETKNSKLIEEEGN
ncbi:hypothetical protein ACTWP4_14395 [Gracilibacillus sp. D59]|uniref:hypothetical protein n=1 Tax=Gracilibacillus sp. D59 TaxID=3457434 RepID=UPI003FCE728D